MKKVLIVIILVVMTLSLGASEEIEIKKINPFWYVYLEFHGKFNSQLTDKIKIFLNECKKQNIQSKIKDDLFGIYFDESVWGLGFPVEQSTDVNEPLKKSFFNHNQIVRQWHKGCGRSLSIAYSLLASYIHQKGFRITAPILRKWKKKPQEIEQRETYTEMIMPVNWEKESQIILDTIHKIVMLLSIFLYSLLSIFILTQKKRDKKISTVFAIFMLAHGMHALAGLTYYFQYYIIKFFPSLFEMGISFIFLAPPALFFYIKTLTKKKIVFRITYLVHLTPFIADLLIRIFRFYIQSIEDKRVLIVNFSIFSQKEIIARSVILSLLVFSYILASVIVLHKHQTAIKGIYSNTERINLNWLKMVLYGYIFIFLINTLKFLLIIHRFASGFLYFIYDFSILSFAILIFFKGLKQPQIFPPLNEKNSKERYKKPLLSKSMKDHYLRVLLGFVKKNKPYLNPALNLHELAGKIFISPYYLSYIINECLNQNFFDFINSYRIKESQQILLNPAAKQKTILEVLYECGFNSKSVFNSAFKKHAGMTPTEFRKRSTSRDRST